MERVRDLMDLEDFYEEERTIRQGMASRAGVLGLMLHSTIGNDSRLRQNRNAAEWMSRKLFDVHLYFFFP